MKYMEPDHAKPKEYTRKILASNIRIKEDSVHCTKQYPEKIKESLNEYGVESTLGGKKRLPYLSHRRNEMPIISPGDKIYKSVEFSNDFYKQGGLIVGSTNKIQYNKTDGKRGDNFYASLDLSIKTLNKNKLWKNKIVKESLEFDNKYVDNLNTWEDTYLILNENEKIGEKDDKKMKKK